MTNKDKPPGAADEARIVVPADLISTGEAAKILGVDRATIVRRARTGKIPIVAQLDADTGHGAYVFDRNEVKGAGEDPKNGMAHNGTSRE
ncbi:MerR-like helix-turn-helix DNA binding domain protein [Arthrobacter phage Whytu]|uniref:MerR-like helix-turn-helix DNA binding domain protein n=1 Tax=Arthrobacter phage Whytu TaxID=2713260 RepID=A0A6G8R2R0_9CAUD|nr:MerR-like helix-turn-helix DNA binding domain protein [Arthrobacter phage Whytu]QIN94484.1 MerR-like helix-turn-helix DNA binding domain protein [Arthrobacter phage Whytu]